MHVPSLNPPAGSLRAWLLFFNRASRCIVAALVPSVGIVYALPSVLGILRVGQLCVGRGQWLPGRALVVSCSGREIRSEFFAADWCHYVICVWCAVQFLYNFTESCFREPGFVSQSVQTADKKGRFQVHFQGDRSHQKPAVWFLPRWCAHCKAWKPPRSHHSKRVGQCVLRMDHYCVVTENVIGAHNHGHFVLMVTWAHVGLLYGMIMILRTAYTVWTPYWTVFRKLSAIAEQRQKYWFWIVTGGNVHVLKSVVGWELPTFLFFFVCSWLLIGPLLSQLLAASRGATVLETSDSVTDAVELPNGQAVVLQDGAFSRGSRFANIRVLLGRNWILRSFFPMRGNIEACEEAASPLSELLREAIEEIVQKSK